jgi:hypothetical protein
VEGTDVFMHSHRRGCIPNTEILESNLNQNTVHPAVPQGEMWGSTSNSPRQFQTEMFPNSLYVHHPNIYAI